MKIGLIRHEMDEPQGGARQIALLARDLQELGEDVTLYCYSYDRERCFADILAGVPVLAVENVTAPRWLRSDRGWRRVAAQLQRYYLEAPAVASLIAPDTELLNPHEWLAHRAAALCARRRGTPVVWSYNDPSGWHVADGGRLRRLPMAMFGWLDTRMVNRFAALTTLSERVATTAQSTFTVPGFDPAPGPPGRAEGRGAASLDRGTRRRIREREADRSVRGRHRGRGDPGRNDRVEREGLSGGRRQARAAHLPLLQGPDRSAVRQGAGHARLDAGDRVAGT